MVWSQKLFSQHRRGEVSFKPWCFGNGAVLQKEYWRAKRNFNLVREATIMTRLCEITLPSIVWKSQMRRVCKTFVFQQKTMIFHVCSAQAPRWFFEIGQLPNTLPSSSPCHQLLMDDATHKGCGCLPPEARITDGRSPLDTWCPWLVCQLIAVADYVKCYATNSYKWKVADSYSGK